MTLPIYVYGSPVLRRMCEPIEPDYPGLKELIANMIETMHNAEGVGLAAPQIGRSIRLFVVDASPFADEEPALKDFKKVFINAQITERFGDNFSFTEGCLSIPGINEAVVRPSKIRMTYCDENFVEHEEEFDGMAARIIQHEHDHIDGKLFIDYATPLKKRLMQGKLKKMSRGQCHAAYPCKIG